MSLFHSPVTESFQNLEKMCNSLEHDKPAFKPQRKGKKGAIWVKVGKLFYVKGVTY